jgi:hypothetical protein
MTRISSLPSSIGQIIQFLSINMEFDWTPAKWTTPRSVKVTWKTRPSRHLDHFRTQSKQTRATALWLKQKCAPSWSTANPYQKKADGVPLKGKTDWKRLDRQTAAQVEDIAAGDREGLPMSNAEWARAEIVRPEKSCRWHQAG